MAEVGVWAEWETSVEVDPEALAKAIEHTLAHLVAECRDAGVAPIGALTVKTRPVESLPGLSMIRRSVNLQVDPAARWDWPVAAEPPSTSRWTRAWRWIKRYVLLWD